MSALFALIAGKDWLYGGLIVLLIIFGVHLHHKILAEGITEQKAADDKATAVLVANTAKQTAELQAKATMAEQAYDKQQTDLANYRASNRVQPVRLCLNAHNSSPVVPKVGAVNNGTQGASSTPVGIQSMPSPNNSGGAGTTGPDISGMLELLAARADEVSAELREVQARE